jgi:hypothetical protein
MATRDDRDKFAVIFVRGSAIRGFH